jgi:hypothetical protein
MPINGEWHNPAIFRCYRKKRWLSWSIAERIAARDSATTGELIIAYQCLDCRGYHVGHADLSQIMARQTPSSQLPKPAQPIALPSHCPHCGGEIPEERRSAAEMSKTSTVYCSKKCQQKGSKKARHAARAAKRALDSWFT